MVVASRKISKPKQIKKENQETTSTSLIPRMKMSQGTSQPWATLAWSQISSTQLSSGGKFVNGITPFGNTRKVLPMSRGLTHIRSTLGIPIRETNLLEMDSRPPKLIWRFISEHYKIYTYLFDSIRLWTEPFFCFIEIIILYLQQLSKFCEKQNSFAIIKRLSTQFELRIMIIVSIFII